MNHTCITIEGGLLAPDFLESIADAEGQKASDFGLTGRRTLVDEVSAIWSDVRSYWDAFQRRLERSTDESRTSVTREQWMIPLLEALGYPLTHHRSGVAINGRNYVISHRTGDSEEDLPVHIEAFDQDLGSRPASGRGTMSPHAMLQDYLNRTEHLWAIVTNGSTLRLLRDSSYFTRPSYVEFDLKQMLEGERLDEFFLFYRLVHRSRLPKTMADGDACLLEKYHQLGIEQGGRIRDGLRDAVTNAIIGLGRGFLQHRRNDALREAVTSGQLTPQHYYQQLLYLIYRLLFLMVAEERNLLRCDGELPAAAVEARRFFTLGRLRDLASEPLSAPERFDDLYLNLQALFLSLCKEDFAATLGLPPLNGELFDCGRTSDIGTAYLDNATLLRAIRGMSYFSSRDERVQRRVNYGALDVEELGSVYESLLDFQPLLRHDDGRFTFDLGTGTERKTTGSYYTRPELVQELIKSALEPVITDRLGAAKPNQRENALLGLKVCDPACGSGHFLLAAARRIGTELARVRTGEEASAPDAVREAVRDVITHCIYGVDKNPLAVDLCKVALWIEGHSCGKPLTFLDHRIRCGDSLVGVFDPSVLETGIPDEAFDPVSEDDRKLASAIKKQNKKERVKGVYALSEDATARAHELVEERWELETVHDDTPEDIHRKRDAWERLQREDGPLWRERMKCHLWTAAFFTEVTPEAQESRRIPTTADLRRFMDNPDAVDARLKGHVWARAERNRFFHWPLEFPEVFERGGFDCVLGNPPFLGGLKISTELGEPYLRWVKCVFEPAGGTTDLCAYVLRRAHAALGPSRVLGMVAVNTIAQGDSRQHGLALILAQGGAIRAARRFIKWSGDASVEVNLLAVGKGSYPGSPSLDGREVEFISSRLDIGPEVTPKPLPENQDLAFIGDYVCGEGFLLSDAEAAALIEENPRNSDVVLPYIVGQDLNSSPSQAASRHVICFHDYPLGKAQLYSGPFGIVEQRVRPEREKVKRDKRRERWWHFGDYAKGLHEAIEDREWVTAASVVSQYWCPVRVPTSAIFAHRVVVFVFDDYTRYGILQSNLHEVWARRLSSTLEERLNYSPSDCFETFPFPALHGLERIHDAGERYHSERTRLMLTHGIGLTGVYQRLHDPQDESGICSLREMHRELDEAVIDAYSWGDVDPEHGFHPDERGHIRYTISLGAKEELFRRLLELNQARAGAGEGAAVP